MSDYKNNVISLAQTTKFIVDNRGKTAPTEKSGIPLIGTNCISNKSLYPLYLNLRYVSLDTYNNWFRSHPEPGDIILTLKGSQNGAVCLVPEKVDFAIAQDMVALRVNEDIIDPLFLFAALRSPDVQTQIKNLDVSGVIPHFKKSDFDKLLLPYPERKLQKFIGELYFNLSKKIYILERQNETLEAMAETLFRQWFVEKAKESWEIGELGDAIEIFDSKRIPISKMQRDKMKDGELYPYYGAATIMDYVNDYIFDGEYILLGEDGTVRTDEGYPVLQYATGRFWVNNHAHIFQAKPPYSNFFIWNYLVKKNIDEIVTGAVQPKINQTNLMSLDFPNFPEDLVQEYNEQTKAIFMKINKNKSQISTLEKLRDTILPKLMSGDSEVKVEYDKQRGSN